MDHVNRFDTRTTHALVRLEYGIALGVCVALFVPHVGEVRWLPAVVLFAYIDLVGYLPGAIAHHRARGGRIPKAYYVLYNVMHSFVTQAVVVGAWVLVSGWEWALLAVPIHLLGDRALFGNALKPFSVPFEPAPTSARPNRELVLS
ncbi:hypothetical protein [Actinophytocola sp.]|uniref:hypothetical protein n=1 Tax=Actinophytocola sp. TaxID=1872138 RepID=UPI003D6BC62B